MVFKEEEKNWSLCVIYFALCEAFYDIQIKTITEILAAALSLFPLGTHFSHMSDPDFTQENSINKLGI